MVFTSTSKTTMTFHKVVALVVVVCLKSCNCYEPSIIVAGMLETKDTQVSFIFNICLNITGNESSNSQVLGGQNHLNYGIPQRRGAGAASLGGGKAIFTGGIDG